LKKFALDNLNILITGASSGIGRACAAEIARMGAKCHLLGRNEKGLQETAQLCIESVSYTLDLTKEDEVKKLAASIDKLDGIVHCAGVINPRPIKFLKKEQLEEIFAINYHAPVMLTAELLQAKKMNSGASFVFISSISSKHPYFGSASYTGSKAALESFSRSLALETAAQKMRSNVLLPGLVNTRMLQETKEAAGEENFQNYEKQYPLGFGEPEDVANAVCFLLSREARWITGSELVMDGGLRLNSKK
jgi:NAD(P)-dependent dehydrogenase (short-subunit alcohol dehydrogenase family)